MQHLASMVSTWFSKYLSDSHKDSVSVVSAVLETQYSFVCYKMRRKWICTFFSTFEYTNLWKMYWPMMRNLAFSTTQKQNAKVSSRNVYSPRVRKKRESQNHAEVPLFSFEIVQVLVSLWQHICAEGPNLCPYEWYSPMTIMCLYTQNFWQNGFWPKPIPVLKHPPYQLDLALYDCSMALN